MLKTSNAMKCFTARQNNLGPELGNLSGPILCPSFCIPLYCYISCGFCFTGCNWPGPGSSWGDLTVPPASKEAESPSNLFYVDSMWEGGS